MFSRFVHTTAIAACFALVLCSAGCQTQNTTTAANTHENDGNCAARLDQLVTRLDRPQPYPYRKPVRDSRARTLQLITIEAEHLLQTPAPEAITGDIRTESRRDTQEAIKEIHDAAARGDAIGVSLAYHRYRAAE